MKLVSSSMSGRSVRGRGSGPSSHTKRGWLGNPQILIGGLGLVLALLLLPSLLFAHDFGKLDHKACSVHQDGLYCTYYYEKGIVWTKDGHEIAYSPQFSKTYHPQIPKSNSWDPTSEFLLYGFLSLQMADIVTTSVAILGKGDKEMNPLLGWALNSGNPLLFFSVLVPVKAGYSWLVVRETEEHPKHRKLTLGILDTIFSVVVLHNIGVITGAP